MTTLSKRQDVTGIEIYQEGLNIWTCLHASFGPGSSLIFVKMFQAFNELKRILLSFCLTRHRLSINNWTSIDLLAISRSFLPKHLLHYQTHRKLHWSYADNCYLCANCSPISEEFLYFCCLNPFSKAVITFQGETNSQNLVNQMLLVKGKEGSL